MTPTVRWMSCRESSKKPSKDPKLHKCRHDAKVVLVSEGWCIHNIIDLCSSQILTTTQGVLYSLPILPFVAGIATKPLSSFFFDQISNACWGDSENDELSRFCSHRISLCLKTSCTHSQCSVVERLSVKLHWTSPLIILRLNERSVSWWSRE